VVDRTLSQGVADLRLSDTRLRQDLAAARALVLNAARDIERQLRLNIPLTVDTSTARAQLRRATDQLVADVGAGLVIPIEVDASSAATAFESVEARAEPISVTVDADTSQARRAVIRLAQDVESTPLETTVAVDTGPVDNFNQYAATNIPEQFGVTGEQSGSRFGVALSGALLPIFRTTALAAGAFLATSLFKGFQRLTTIEDASASLEVALGSAAAAAETLDDVLDVVRGTPFNLDQFAEAASNMVSFGIEAQKVPGYLTAIGEASASKGGRANEFAQRLSTTFGQIATLGRITNEEIQSLQLTGVNALAILGNQTGKTTVEMQKLISEGLVPANFALDTLSDGILNGTTGINGATNAFAGTMEKLRLTLTGAIGGFGAATARFGVSIIRPIQDTLTIGFNSASDALDRFGSSVERNLLGFADSPGVRSFQEALSDLPGLVEDVIDGVSGLGPALAPLGVAFGALGLGALKPLLGTLGNLLPGVTGPLGFFTVAITTLIATVPELREDALPVLKELGATVVEVGVILGSALGDAVEASVPILRTLIEVIGELTPLVRTLGVGGASLLRVFVPLIEGLADGFDKVPLPVITALIGLFAAGRIFNAFQSPFEGLIEDLDKFNDGMQLAEDATKRQRIAGALDVIGVSAEGLARTIEVTAISVTSALSGIALASDNTAVQMTGAFGAISSVLLGLGTGGVPGAAIAAGAVGLGVIAGKFFEARREAKEFKDEVDGLADVLINELNLAEEAIADFQIIDAQEAVDKFIKLVGPALAEAGRDLGFSVADAIEVDESSFDPAKAALETLIDITDAYFESQRRVNELIAQGIDPTNTEALGIAVQDTFEGNIILADRYNAALAEAQLLLGGNLEIATSANAQTSLDILQIQIDLQDELNDSLAAGLDARADREEVDRRELASRNLGTAAIQEIILLSRELNETPIEIFDKLVEGGALAEIYDGIFAITGIPFEEALDPLLDKVTDVGDAAEFSFEQAEDAADVWKEALRGVAEELDIIGDTIDGVQNRADFLAGLRGIGEGLSEVINETELRAAERLADQIDRQYERVQAAADRVRDATRDFAFDEQIAFERIAELEELGATRGAAGVRRDLERDRQKVADLAADLAEEQAKLAGLQTERAGLTTTAITLGEELRRQAAGQGISLFELLITQPTPEAARAFRSFVAGPVGDAIREIDRVLEAEGLDAALAVAETYRDLLESAFGQAFGTSTGDQLVAEVFNIRDLTVKGKAASLVETFTRFLATELAPFELEILKSNLSDFDFAAGELEEFEKIVNGLDPTILVSLGFEDLEGDLAKLRAGIEVSLRIDPFTGLPLDPVTGEPVGAGAGPLRYPFRFGFGAADGGIFEFFKDGGTRTPENHVAHIARDVVRVYNEPEAGGEAYIPLALSKRSRSERILGDVASVFNMEVVRRMELPRSMSPITATVSNTEQISRAVTEGIRQAMAGDRRLIAERFDRAVHIDKLVYGGDETTGRRQARRVRADLAALALRRG
jgi:tape measure domain-containing protein